MNTKYNYKYSCFKYSYSASLLLLLLTQTALSVATEMAPHAVPDNWKCKWCDYQEGFRGDIDLGLGFVSDDAFRFGHQTGLNDKGLYLIGNTSTHYQDEDANYWDLNVRNVGIGSRWLSTEGGQQGKYKFWLEYDEIPYLATDSARSPFIGKGTASLSLPDDWIPGDTTDAMPALRSSLRKLQLDSERTSYRLGTTLHTGLFGETYSLKFSRHQQDGISASGVAFGINDAFSSQSTLLPVPIDYITDQLELDVAYTAPNWQARLGYYGSFFKNANPRLQWQNPYADPASDTATGQLALAPDNEFHQLYFSGGYQFNTTTRATWYSATGIMLQDENFLPYSSNPSLNSGNLPERSLDAKARTWTFNGNVFSQPAPKLNWNISYAHNEYDNKANQAIWDYVVTDAMQSLTQRRNPVYSFRTRSLKAKTRYRLHSSNNILAGVDYRINERNNQAVSKTNERTAWAKWRYKPGPTVDMAVKLAKAQRDGSNYQALTEIIEPENTLLRKYNLADRDRDTLGAVFSYTPLNTLNLGLNVDYSRDDYTESVLGLTRADRYNYSFDAVYSLTQNVSISAFYTREHYTSEQAGSQTFTTPDWYSKNKDTINTVGIGIRQTSARHPIEWGIDYVYSRAEENQTLSGSIELSKQTLPETNNRLQQLQFYTRYRWQKNLRLTLDIAYEKYNEDDFAIDSIDVDTYTQLLSLGNAANDYEVYVVSTTIQYSF